MGVYESKKQVVLAYRRLKRDLFKIKKKKQRAEVAYASDGNHHLFHADYCSIYV